MPPLRWVVGGHLWAYGCVLDVAGSSPSHMSSHAAPPPQPHLAACTLHPSSPAPSHSCCISTAPTACCRTCPTWWRWTTAAARWCWRYGAWVRGWSCAARGGHIFLWHDRTVGGQHCWGCAHGLAPAFADPAPWPPTRAPACPRSGTISAADIVTDAIVYPEPLDDWLPPDIRQASGLGWAGLGWAGLGWAGGCLSAVGRDGPAEHGSSRRLPACLSC